MSNILCQYNIPFIFLTAQSEDLMLVISEDQVFFGKFDFSVFQQRELMIPNLCFRLYKIIYLKSSHR